MNMKNLYEEMKDVLDFFGLKFREMDKVLVVVNDDGLHFAYDGRVVSILKETEK